MSMHGLPFLMTAYSANLLYILEQRLQVQQTVPAERKSAVFIDVANAAFLEAFVAELTPAQPLYQPAMVREICDRLVTCSVLRLNETSREKLFDLMTMACKFQVVECRGPRDLVTMGERFLQALKGIIPKANIGAGEKAIADLAANLSDGQLADARYAMMNYFLDVRTKAQLYIREGVQAVDGTYVLRRGPAPQEKQRPPMGTVKYFDDNGTETKSSTFTHPDAGAAEATAFYLGRNFFVVDAAKEKEKKAAKGPAAVAAPTGPRAKPQGKHKYAQQHSSQSAMSSLNQFIVQTAKADTVPMALFPGDESEAPATAKSSGPAKDRLIDISSVSREEVEKANAALMGVMADMKKVAVGAEEEDDLLDLMDKA